MRLSAYFVSFFVVFLVFVAFGSMFSYMSAEEQYNVTVSEQYQSAYTNVSVLQDYIEDTTKIGLDMEDKSREAKILEGEFEDSSKSELPAVKEMAQDSISIAKNLIINTSNILRLPPAITAVGIGILLTLLTFAVISLIFRFKS